MTSKFARVIGVDVSADRLDLCDSHGKLPCSCENTVEAIRKWVKELGADEQTVVVCEATGSYEQALVEILLDAGVAVAVANPRQVRQFAQGMGLREKSDRIDAWVATRHNPVIAAFYTKLVKKGKPKKLALVAAMRKLLTMLNDMARRKVLWSEPPALAEQRA